MSSILKALKRLEEEKATREGGQVDIARDILLGEGGEQARRGASLLWFGLVAGIAVVAISLSWWVLGSDSRSARKGETQKAAQAVGPSHLTGQAGTEPALQPRVVEKTRLESGVPVQVQTAPVHSPPRPVTASKPAQNSLAGPNPYVKEDSGQPVSTELSKEGSIPDSRQESTSEAAMSVEIQTVTASSPPDSTRPNLLVSGIIYQENAADCLAVVNDLPVMQGTVIDGFTISAIERDRVWFSRDNERFSVALEGEPDRSSDPPH